MSPFARYVVGAVFAIAAGSALAAPPAGTYQGSCTGAALGADNVLKAKCRTMSGSMLDTSLKLPCNGSIDNIDGKLTCTGGPVGNVPPGSYLQSCADARVQNGVLTAKCRRANQTVADTSMRLPCTGKIDNLNGTLTCVGGTTPPACPAATTVIDGACVRTSGRIVTKHENVRRRCCGMEYWGYGSDPTYPNSNRSVQMWMVPPTSATKPQRFMLMPDTTLREGDGSKCVLYGRPRDAYSVQDPSDRWRFTELFLQPCNGSQEQRGWQISGAGKITNTQHPQGCVQYIEPGWGSPQYQFDRCSADVKLTSWQFVD